MNISDNELEKNYIFYWGRKWCVHLWCTTSKIYVDEPKINHHSFDDASLYLPWRELCRDHGIAHEDWYSCSFWTEIFTSVWTRIQACIIGYTHQWERLVHVCVTLTPLLRDLDASKFLWSASIEATSKKKCCAIFLRSLSLISRKSCNCKVSLVTLILRYVAENLY